MKKLVLIASTVLLSLSTIASAISIQALNKGQVTDAISNKTITTIPLVTINGKLEKNTFTGFFHKEGQLNGKMANQPGDSPQADAGKWTVKADGALCATWDHWNDSKQLCVSVYKLTNGLLFVNTENKKLETVVLDADIQSGNKIS